MNYEYDQFFPFQNIRSEQRQAIEFALDAFLNSKKKFCVCEVGAGGGKSAIAMTIARYMQSLFESNDPRVTLGSSYVLTTQKVLQEQYMRDFGPPAGKLTLLKSAGAYCCKLFEENAYSEQFSCAEIQRLIKSCSKISFMYDVCEKECTFKSARQHFFDSHEGITNYAYFLTTASYTFNLQRRGLMVLDEAHNVESMVSNFVKISFSNFFYRTTLNVKTPAINATQANVYDWLVNICRPKLRDVIRIESKKLGKLDDQNEALALAKKLEQLKRNFSRIESFIQIYDPKTWVLDSSKTDRRGERVFEFKPIKVGDHCQTFLYNHCDRVLMLSATILDNDVFCESVGVDKKDVAFIRIPSPFPPKNRPIHILSVGSMSRATIEKTLPKITEVVKEIMTQHPNEKGIIHCTTFKIANHIMESINSKRLLTHTTENREEVIKYHMSTSEPTVLVSPSMMEGVDLADDASRFQIICKIPFPYLGDAAVKKRMELNPEWYPYQTVKAIVQSLGRSIRSEDDHATSYILDSDWNRFFRNNVKMFPDGFSDAIVE